MAHAAIFVGWGEPARAREPHALELFQQALRYFVDLQERGEIESFEQVVLEPHGGDLNGFILIRGERDRLNRLRSEDEFVRLSARAQLVVDNFGVVTAYIGDSLWSQLEVYQQQVQEQLHA